MRNGGYTGLDGVIMVPVNIGSQNCRLVKYIIKIGQIKQSINLTAGDISRTGVAD